MAAAYMYTHRVIMSSMSSQITGVFIVRTTVHSGADQRKHQSSASLAFVRGIRGWPVNSPHKWPVTRKIFPLDDVIMIHINISYRGSHLPLSFLHTVSIWSPYWLSHCFRWANMINSSRWVLFLSRCMLGVESRWQRILQRFYSLGWRHNLHPNWCRTGPLETLLRRKFHIV